MYVPQVIVKSLWPPCRPRSWAWGCGGGSALAARRAHPPAARAPRSQQLSHYHAKRIVNSEVRSFSVTQQYGWAYIESGSGLRVTTNNVRIEVHFFPVFFVLPVVERTLRFIAGFPPRFDIVLIASL